MEVINHKVPLPNATPTLVLGILSIVIGCFPFGLVLGIIGLVISKADKDLYLQNPELYTGYGNISAGRIMSIIGIVIGGISLLSLIIWFIIGSAIIGSLIGLGTRM